MRTQIIKWKMNDRFRGGVSTCALSPLTGRVFFQIPKLCNKEEMDEGHHGEVVDCLKAKFKKIKTKECQEVCFDMLISC